MAKQRVWWTNCGSKSIPLWSDAASACSTMTHERQLYTLAHSASTPNGVLITRYVRSDEVSKGTFTETM